MPKSDRKQDGFLHVVLDARGIQNELDGTGRYSLNLIEQVVRQAPDINFTVLIRQSLGECFRQRVPARAHTVELPYRHIDARTIFCLGSMVDRLRADLYHSLFAFQPIWMKTPGMMTLHDLMWLRDPWLQSGGKPLRLVTGWAYHRALVRWSMSRAKHIIVPSRTIQRDVSGMWSALAAKVRVVAEGVDACFLEQAAAGSLPNPHPVLERVGKQPFFLHITNARPYKNGSRLMRAFQSVERHEKVQMVIVGSQSVFSRKLLSEIRRLGLEQRVVWLGSVSSLELAALLRAATALLLPSLCEGFGLPVVEAMASGCPVMTSDRGALAELAGDAALCINPLQTDAIAQGMRRLLGDQMLCNTLRQRGRAKAAGFTWEKAGRQIVALYRSVDRIRYR